MADRVILPLVGIGTLVLDGDVYRAALEAGAAMTASASPAPATTDSEPLIDARELSRSLNLPKSCIYEKARTCAIPSVRVGKHVRFQRSRVLEALGATAQVAVGRA
jgi:excisionase family DNA binding protein